MSAVLTDRVRSIVATLFDMPVEQITPQSSAATVENWDSMGQLTLILELEQQFDIALTPEQTEQMTDVASIVTMLETEHGI